MNHHKIEVLDHGFVELVGTSYDFIDLAPYSDANDVLVSLPRTLDAMIARAARASYTQGTKSVSDDARLIERLMRDRHTSPFEMCEFKFVIRAPLFVVQQLLRHRTASLNQESARYSVIEDQGHEPTQLRKQHASNKQMSGDPIDYPENKELLGEIREAYGQAYVAYEILLEAGVAREQARMVLPHGTYTQLVWKMDLHNLLHFLKLRLDPHAQPEIQAYASAMLALIRPYVPFTVAAWEKHVLEARTVHQGEFNVLAALFHAWVSRQLEGKTDEDWAELALQLQGYGLEERDVLAFCAKMELTEMLPKHVQMARDLRDKRT
jgi:thymidylate synthase (FAD)